MTVLTLGSVCNEGWLLNPHAVPTSMSSAIVPGTGFIRETYPIVQAVHNLVMHKASLGIDCFMKIAALGLPVHCDDGSCPLSPSGKGLPLDQC